MKKVLCLIILIQSIQISFAQAPHGMNYQAVARNSAGTILANRKVGVKFSIINGSPAGTPVYVETQTDTTNQFGLFTAVIGNGTPVTGTFSAINWQSGNMYLEVGIDSSGGSNYVTMGNSQLQSVPYALAVGNQLTYKHTSSNANISGDHTILSYPNQDSTDLVYVTHNWGNSSGSVNNIYFTVPIGVFWNGSAWCIFREDTSNMPVNAAFNVLVIKQ